MKIRQASALDYSRIKKLIAEYPEQLLQEHLPRAREFFIAVEKGKVVGCAALVIYSKRLAEIRSVAVAKEWSGKGIATALIERCTAVATKKNIYEILVVTGSKDFFEKQGFGAFKNEKFALLKILKG